MATHIHIYPPDTGELIKLGEQIMATVGELETKLDTLIQTSAEEKAEVTEALAAQATELAAAKQLIVDLTAQIAAGSPVTQAQLDAITAKVDAATVSVEDIISPVPAP